MLSPISEHSRELPLNWGGFCSASKSIISTCEILSVSKRFYDSEALVGALRLFDRTSVDDGAEYTLRYKAMETMFNESLWKLQDSCYDSKLTVLLQKLTAYIQLETILNELTGKKASM